MQDRRQHRRERTARADQQPGRVDGDGHAVVLPDYIHCPLAQVPNVEQAVQVVVGQRDIGGLDGDVGSGKAHGDPDIGGGQRRGVVDAVADHPDDVAVVLQLAHRRELVLRHDLGAPLINPQFVGDNLGDLRVVAGEHDDPANPIGPQLRQHLGRLRTHLVAQADQADQRAVHREQQRGLRLAAQLVDPLRRLLGHPNFFGAQQRRTAQQQGPTVGPGPHAQADQHLALLVWWDADAAFLRRADHRLGQRMT
ncbi:Uncharacterised protein [Mycobacterium tuberculosis]|nr:Uncharacterised protein [Mycobacterium tuberculosis]